MRGPEYRFYCYPDNEFCKRMLLYGGLPDYHEMKFLIDYLAPGDAFLDIGANTGIYSLLAASMIGSEGCVDAFEPDERSRDRFSENIILNRFRGIHIHPQAVGSTSEQVRFLRDRDVGNRIRTSLDGGQATVELECVCLDEVAGERLYALGKMDVEGAEPLVLQGAQRMLAAGNPPVWLLELNGKLHDYGFAEWGSRTMAEGSWLRFSPIRFQLPKTVFRRAPVGSFRGRARSGKPPGRDVDCPAQLARPARWLCTCP